MKVPLTGLYRGLFCFYAVCVIIIMDDVFEITEDLMLGGLKIVQDERYYRFTSDSVLLSRFASCKNGEKVADFCAGAGIVGLHYYGLNADKVSSVHLFELQPELYLLAEKSVEINSLQNKFTVVKGRLQDAPACFNGFFSLILCNPPYKKAGTGEQNLSAHLAVCRHETQITLEEIAATAKRMLTFGGRLCICQKTDRLTDLICAMRNNGIEPARLALIQAKNGEPYLVMVEGVKGRNPQLKVQNVIVN